MADETNTAEGSAPVPTAEAPATGSSASPEGEAERMAAAIAEIEAMPEAAEGAADPAAGDATEAKAEDAKTETEAAEPAPEPEPVASARKILASAARKERKALEAVPQAEAKLLQLFRDDPAAFLQRAGVSIQDWLTRVAGSDAAADKPAPSADDRVRALEEAQARREVESQAAEVRRLTLAVQDQVRAVAAEKFPAIAKAKADANAYQLVTDVMVDYYNTHGKPLSWQSAAATVERHLRSLAGEADAPVPAPKATAPEKATSTRQASQTLTNTATRGAAPTTDALPMDPDERYRAVLRELGG